MTWPHDEGWVSVGITSDTAQFAASTIISWWEHLGKQRYPDAKTLTITADCRRLQQPPHPALEVELQRLADTTGLQIRVCHFPPGTSKWNKIEHRLFSFVSLNWRGKPLESLEIIVNLIAATTTNTGLKVYARLDEQHLPPRNRGHRRATRRRQHHQTPIPRRLELHHHSFNNCDVSP